MRVVVVAHAMSWISTWGEMRPFTGHASCPTVRASGHGLSYAGSPLFLNGINLAWVHWGTDLDATPSRGRGTSTYCAWEESFRFVKENGGNAIRVWLFTDPEASLEWEDGLVAGLKDGVMWMVHTLLALAQHYGVFVVPVLFNGAFVKSDSAAACSIFSDVDVMRSALEHAVRPLAKALAGHPQIAMWEGAQRPRRLPARRECRPRVACPPPHPHPSRAPSDQRAGRTPRPESAAGRHALHRRRARRDALPGAREPAGLGRGMPAAAALAAALRQPRGRRGPQGRPQPPDHSRR